MPNQVTITQAHRFISRLSTWQAIALILALMFLGPVVAVFVLVGKWPSIVGLDADTREVLFARSRR